jgi:hypothetical protein
LRATSGASGRTDRQRRTSDGWHRSEAPARDLPRAARSDGEALRWPH